MVAIIRIDCTFHTMDEMVSNVPKLEESDCKWNTWKPRLIKQPMCLNSNPVPMLFQCITLRRQDAMLQNFYIF